MKKIFMLIFIILLFIFLIPAHAYNFWNLSDLFYPHKFSDEDADLSAFPEKRPPSTRNIFIFNPRKLAWAVYNTKGERVGTGRASGGKDYCTDINEQCRTVEGEYTVFRKEDKDCTSNTFPIGEGGGAPMPHCMFFYKGYAIHGTKHVPKVNASHGCIRISKAAAEWVNTHYIHEGSLVIVEPY